MKCISDYLLPSTFYWPIRRYLSPDVEIQLRREIYYPVGARVDNIILLMSTSLYDLSSDNKR